MTYTSPTWIDVPPGTPPPPGAVLLDAANLQALSDTVEALDGTRLTIPGVVADGGTTDNYAVIQAYLNALSAAAGGNAYLPGGTIATSPLDIPAGVILCGQGGIDYGAFPGRFYGTTLIPYTAGQDHVIRCNGIYAGYQDLNVNALQVGLANVAAHAIVINAICCRARNYSAAGGSSSTLFGNGAAGLQFVQELFTIRTDDITGNVHPISTTSNDWQSSDGIVNGYAGSILQGPCSIWDDVHFVSGTPTTGGGALITENGSQTFTSCYLDGTVATALVDRSSADHVSSYVNCFVLQSNTAITGIPIFLETSTPGAGVHITNFSTRSKAAGSTFTYLVDGPISTTKVIGVDIPNGWLTGGLTDQTTPAGYWAGVTVAGTVKAPSISTRAPAGAVTETFTRAGAAMSNNLAALTSQTLIVMAVDLKAGDQVFHFNFIAGSTGATTPANWWMCLLDANLNLLATSLDKTTTALAASTAYALPVAATADGSASSYTCSASGLFYVGLMVNAAVVPTLYGVNGQAGSNNQAPILAGSSDTGQTTPPAFPHAATALTAKQGMPYLWLT